VLPLFSALNADGPNVLAFKVGAGVSGQVDVVGVGVVAERGVLGLEGDFLLAFLIELAWVGDRSILSDDDTGDDLFFLGNEVMLPRPGVGERGDVTTESFRTRDTGAWYVVGSSVCIRVLSRLLVWICNACDALCSWLTCSCSSLD
jgi:hypothetical protein